LSTIFGGIALAVHWKIQNPMTYTGKSVKQYVAGVSGGAVVAFALQ